MSLGTPALCIDSGLLSAFPLLWTCLLDFMDSSLGTCCYFFGSTIRYPSIHIENTTPFSELVMAVSGSENRYRVDMCIGYHSRMLFSGVSRSYHLVPIRHKPADASHVTPQSQSDPEATSECGDGCGAQRWECRGIETRVPPRPPAPRQASLLRSPRGGQSIPTPHPCQNPRRYRKEHLPGGHSLLAKSVACRAAPCHPEAGQVWWLFSRWDHVPRHEWGEVRRPVSLLHITLMIPDSVRTSTSDVHSLANKSDIMASSTPKACLRVEGTNIVDSDGKPVILKGVSPHQILSRWFQSD